ncbi:MAG TPA: large conductance mechanosensitive channel protein MscL [Pirellulales bacterium]|nr:large conductance mechanosensitive channel protein MscL [Pirellulales bacterium]
MGLLKEFRDFAMRGNVADMAVGIIIGGAFGKIVSSLVNDIVMPPIGLLLKDVPFKDLVISLRDGHLMDAESAANAVGGPIPTVNIGTFINTVLDFVIVAFVIFMVIRWMNRVLPVPVTSTPAAKKDCPYCKSSIPAAATRCPHCTSEMPGA